MAKHGGTRHIKRIAAPKIFRIKKKEKVWMIKNYPAGHKGSYTIPLLTALKMVGVAKNRKEVKTILNKGIVCVDEKIVKDEKRGIGLMDVLKVGDKNLRVIIDEEGYINLKETKNPSVKLCRIERKNRVKHGKIQITLHDGRNILGDYKDYNVYSVGDTVKISLPDGKILEKYKIERGATSLIIAGKYRGKIVRINDITDEKSTKKSQIIFSIDNNIHRTLKRYAFVIDESAL